MIRLIAEIPDALYQQLATLAERENISVDQLVEIALSAQVSVWTTKNYLEEKSKRGSWEKFQQVLAKVPDTVPEDYDRL